MRYQVRARDKHGDFGILVATYWWRWRAQHRLAKCQGELDAMRKRMHWTGEWEYYVREVP